MYSLLAILFVLQANAQPIAGKLTIGSPSPDFQLQVQAAGQGAPQQRNLASYRGRWLVLDFWTKYCISCIKGFPKLQLLKDSLSKEMNFILIGRNDQKNNSGIEALYQRIASEEKLSLDIAFDTLSFGTFGVTVTPHVVIISPEGSIVRIGRADELSLEKLRNLIHGSELKSAVNAVVKDPLIGRRFQDQDRRSELYAYWNQAQGGARDITHYLHQGQFLTRRSNLANLYMLAYFGMAYWSSKDSLYGRNWPSPLLELKDTTAFDNHFDSGKGFYSYSLQFNDKTASVGKVMNTMQADLGRWTGQHARIETRDMPVWELRTISKATARKLKSKSDTAYFQTDHSSLSLKKGKMQQVMNLLRRYHPAMITLDATGITGDIDLELQASFASLPSLERALEANGLRLVPSTRPMQVLVISDP